MKLFHTSLFDEEGSTSGGGGGTLLSQAGGGGGGSPSAAASGASSGDGDSPPAFDFRSALDDKGNFKPGWEASLPDDLKPSAGAFTKYPNPTEFLRGHANAQKLVGQKTTLKAPAPDAKPEEVEAFNKQVRGVLGVPENVADYKLTKPADLPPGLTWDDKKAGEFAALAHSLNIPPAAAEKIIQWQAKDLTGIAQQGQAKIEVWKQEQAAELEKEWGADFDANMGSAEQFAKLAGFDIHDGELANSAKFCKAMLTGSKLIKPDALVGSDKSATVMDGKAQAEDIRRNANNPWHKAYMGEEGPARQQEAAALMARLQGVKLE